MTATDASLRVVPPPGTEAYANWERPAVKVADVAPHDVLSTVDVLSPEFAIHARSQLRSALRKMSEHDVQVLWALWMAIGPNNHGCDSPAEEFIHAVGLDYLFSLKPDRVGLTPDDVAQNLETFKNTFDDMLAVTRRFNLKYAEAVNGTHDGLEN